MPLYTYECQSCRHRQEEIAPHSHVQTTCEKCNCVADRVPSVPGYRRDKTVVGEG
jgi:putative FmdB family regulatory protein